MKDKIYVSILIILLSFAQSACSTAAGAASTEAVVKEAFTDPFAYCAAVDQIDAPDARYTGPKMSEALFKDYLKAAGLDPNTEYPDTFKQMTIWRCMGGKVYACNFGANIPCDSKANTDKTPAREIVDFCKANQEADFVPLSVTGHNMIYSWHCVNGVPQILEQITTVDAAGYPASYWQLVEPVP